MGCIGSPVSGLVTYGLGVDPIKNGFPGLITGWQFQLLCVDLRVFVGSMSVGSKPLAPGEIQRFYTPVDPRVYMPKTPVVVRVEFYKRGEKIFYTSNYIVTARNATMIVNVVNIANKTAERIMVYARNIKRSIADNVVTGFKRITGQATVKIQPPSVKIENLKNKINKTEI